MKNCLTTTPKLLICLIAILTVGFALHSMSQAQPNTDFAGDMRQVNPPLDSRFVAEPYAPGPAISPEMVQDWLDLLRAENDGSAVFAKGIANLEALLTSLTPPAQSVLLPNYPNPFNPETWIPYQLAHPAEVKVSIYAANGSLVRMLDLGHRAPGVYQNKHRAAYWDGHNAAGERVASGVYFYTVEAGAFRATRKMLIVK